MPGPCAGIANSLCVPKSVNEATCECRPGFVRVNEKRCEEPNRFKGLYKSKTHLANRENDRGLHFRDPLLLHSELCLPGLRVRGRLPVPEGRPTRHLPRGRLRLRHIRPSRRSFRDWERHLATSGRRALQRENREQRGDFADGEKAQEQRLVLLAIQSTAVPERNVPSEYKSVSNY